MIRNRNLQLITIAIIFATLPWFSLGCSGPAANTATKIAAHRFWKKAPTAKQVVQLADRVAALQSGCLVIVGNEFHVWTLDPRDGNDTIADIFYWKQACSKEGCGTDFHLLHEIKEPSFYIDTGRWSARPSQYDVLDEILAAINVADYQR